MRRLLWHIIAGTKGGYNRARIIKNLEERPYNAHQLAELLDLDYKTVRHHIKVLEKNKLIVSSGDSYANMYFLSEQLNKNLDSFNEIWEKIEK
ncbi:MAG: winged helix-turn-helix domain-containing protein [Methanobacterium sp.]|nr:winged helix-turn-helix domain-containing protein [Methanobacterium sp.]